MSAWTKVTKAEGRHKGAQPRNFQSSLISKNGGVAGFLSRLKTSPCTQGGYHDFRKCTHYHSEKDKRRDPIADFYLPDDEDAKSTTEVVYHPARFLTQLCENPSTCPFEPYCAKAHEQSLLRNADVARKDYLKHWDEIALANNKAQKKSLGNYLPTAKKECFIARDTYNWNISPSHHLPSCSEYLLPLTRDSKPWFLINSCGQFFAFLRDVAMKEGLTQIEVRNNHWGDGEYGIAIRGIRSARDGAVAQIANHLINPPSDFFSQDTKKFSSRVVKRLQEKSSPELNTTILGKYSQRAFIEFSEDSISICAVNHPRNAGKQIIYSVFEKLTFWVKQEGHDRFVECCICMDSYNLDEGIQCRNEHFYCGGKHGCINNMVKEQLERLQHQCDKVCCSMCSTSFDTRSLAPVLSKKIWREFEETRIDSKVKLRVEKLSHEFDQRLEDKIKEFVNQYGALDSVVKMQAKRLAKRAQDDILNLKCPHCRAPYAEFTGCMAIQCGTCRKHFCGYCHHGTESGMGAHDHVRQCLVNETNNGSYYATPDQIKTAQRKHRTRELKKFLQALKKDVQNATILELERDLVDHGIEKAALFEFGNLHRELIEQRPV